MIDITASEEVEVSIRFDSKVLWVNVDGKCVLRICDIGNFTLDDKRRSLQVMKKRLIFKPIKHIKSTHHIGLIVDEELYRVAQRLAKKYNLSMKQLARQAFVFAIEHMEENHGKKQTKATQPS